MHISYSYYGELKEDLLSSMESSPMPVDHQPDDDSEIIHNFITRLYEVRQQEKLLKIAEGRCMSTAQYQSLVHRALELAERLGLDISAEIKRGTGIISLSAPHIDLHKEEEPELIEHLAKLISCADYQLFDTEEKYGEVLVCLRFFYDLNATSL